MNLREYLNQEQLTHAAFGKLFSRPVSPGKVNHWVQGTRRVSLVEALEIRRLTDGQVTVEALASTPQAGNRRNEEAVKAGQEPIQEGAHVV